MRVANPIQRMICPEKKDGANWLNLGQTYSSSETWLEPRKRSTRSSSIVHSDHSSRRKELSQWKDKGCPQVVEVKAIKMQTLSIWEDLMWVEGQTLHSLIGRTATTEFHWPKDSCMRQTERRRKENDSRSSKKWRRWNSAVSSQIWTTPRAWSIRRRSNKFPSMREPARSRRKRMRDCRS